MKIDSIVKYINDTDGELSEGIVEGPIIYKGWFKKMEVGVLIIFAISKNLMNP